MNNMFIVKGYVAVSIPQAVGTIAIVGNPAGELVYVTDVSIPQAVGTIAMSKRVRKSLINKRRFQYRKR